MVQEAHAANGETPAEDLGKPAEEWDAPAEEWDAPAEAMGSHAVDGETSDRRMMAEDGISQPQYESIAGHTVMRLDVPKGCGVLEYQHGMLKANAVQGLLPMTLEQDAERIRLSWRVSACHPLSRLFDRRPLTVSELMCLLRPLPALFERMESLLLDTGRLVLDSRFIQYEPVGGTLCFAYRPLENLPVPENPIRDMLRQWFLASCRPNGASDARILSEMLHLLENPDFHWESLNRVLARQMAERVRPGGETFQSGEPFRNGEPFRSGGAKHETQCGEESEKGPDGRAVRSGGTTGSTHRMDPPKSGLQRPVQMKSDLQRIGMPRPNPQPHGLSRKCILPTGAPPTPHSISPAVKMLLIQAVLLCLLLFTWTGGLLKVRGPDGDMARIGLLVTVLALEALGVTGLGKKAKLAAAPAQPGVLDAPRARPSAGLRIPNAPSSLVPENADSHVGHAAPKPEVPAVGSPERPLLRLDRTAAIGEEGEGAPLPVMMRSPYVVGRLRGQVDGCLLHPAVGKVHAEIRRTADGYEVVDLNSRNGTLVNGRRVEPNVPFPLRHDDQVCFAGEMFRIRILDAAVAECCDSFG